MHTRSQNLIRVQTKRAIDLCVAKLHHHAELQRVLARDAVFLRLQLIYIPFAIDETARSPRPVLFGEPDTDSAAEGDVVFEH